MKRSRFLLILLIASALSIFVGALGWLAGGFYGAICLTVVPFLWLIGIQSMWWNWLNQSKIQWYDRTDAASHRVVITPTQVRIGESLADLTGTNLALTRVWIAQGDPRIIRFQKEATLGRKLVTEIWLPVPQGREEDARELVEKFSKEIAKPAGKETA